MTQKRSTIRDVARRATVSPATVSRVLNGCSHIREETRRRVLEAVRELGYTPDRRARALRKRQTTIIGVITPDISNPFFSLLVRGVEHEAQAQEYSVVIGDSGNSLEGERRAIRALLRERVDGVILTAVAAQSDSFTDLLRGEIPLVIADRRVPGVEAPAVVVDGVHDGRRLTSYLIGLGYRDIAFVQGPPEVSTSVDRFEGYRRSLDRHGLRLNPDGLERGDYTYEGGYEAARRLLRRHRPEVLIAANDLMAIGALYALKEAGLSVPEEIGVAGFDNIPLAAWVHPRLTTIEIPAYEIGREAMRLLLRLLRGERISLSASVKVLESRLVPGQSCRRIRPAVAGEGG